MTEIIEHSDYPPFMCDSFQTEYGRNCIQYRRMMMLDFARWIATQLRFDKRGKLGMCSIRDVYKKQVHSGQS